MGGLFYMGESKGIIMEIIIFTVASCVALVIGGILYIRWVTRKINMALQKYHVIQVDVDNPILPDAHIIKHKPLPFTTPTGKVLYFQPLTNDAYMVYVSKYMGLLAKWRGHLAGVKFLLISDLISEANREQMIKETEQLSANPAIIKDMVDLINVILLKNKAINPNKITKREVMKKWTAFDVLQTFKMIYGYNCESVERFISLLMNPTTSDKGQPKVGSGFPKRQESASRKSADGRLMPLYALPHALAKKQQGETMNLKSVEGNEDGTDQ